MRTISPLEMLPLHIIELILDHVAGSSRLHFDGVSVDTEEYAKLLMPLLTACPSFASPAYARIFRTYDMQLTDTLDKKRALSSSLLTSLTDSGVSAHRFAKELVVAVDIIDIFSGAASTRLSRIDHTFPLVCSIVFKFTPPSLGFGQQDYRAIAVPDIEASISAFVQRIKQMAPSMKKIGISLKLCRYNKHETPVHRISNLVGQLSQYAKDVDYDFYHTSTIIDQRLNGLCSLVYGGFDATEVGEQILQLAQRNASTLQLLDIKLVPIAGIACLIRNVDDGYVQYPCLHTFKFNGTRRFDEPRPPVFPGAVPFPSLRRLDIGLVNPFGDDTAFRGNSNTLESLTLQSNHTTFQILREGKVFTPVSHPKLQYVSLEVKSNSEADTFEPDAKHMRRIMSVGPNAPVRIIRGRLDGPGVQHVIPVLGEHTCIQILKLDSIALSLWDAIALAKALPLLTDLHTLYPVVSALLDDVAEHYTPEYVLANYVPTGIRFRCWHFINLHTEEMTVAVRCVLLLALVCPNFDYAATQPMDRQLFIAYMNEMIMTDEFSPYAIRLGRLLYGGSKDEVVSVDAALMAALAARLVWENENGQDE